MSYNAFEVNFDGMVGPTPNYSGLSLGNIASMESKGDVSNPKEAALQGLEKMRLLANLGIKQAVIPPHERPHLPTLRQLGFTGNVETILANVKKTAPWILAQCSSSSSMWTANAATISPSVDSIDTHVHFTTANLAYEWHRSLEGATTKRILKAIFPNPIYFEHHDPLPYHPLFCDEGAANHTRFCRDYHGPGVQLFVWDRTSQDPYVSKPVRFPARCTLESMQALARLHQLYPKQVIYAQQNPQAIDEGVFHNDVISTGNRHYFFLHELSFNNNPAVIKELREKLRQNCDVELFVTEVPQEQVSLKEAVDSFLFNSQIVSLPDGAMHMIAPQECEKFPNIVTLLDDMRADPSNPIQRVHFINLHQSMKNGGGPACLRLRIVLNEVELKAANQGVFLTESLLAALTSWINRYYRDRLREEDLADPKFTQENQEALDALTKILNLGSIYAFQQP